MKKENVKGIIIILVLCILWICHLFDNKISKYGMYLLDSYEVHEIVSVIPRISIAITIIWLIYVIAHILRKKKIKVNLVFTLILTGLLAFQICYLQSASKWIVTIEIAKVVSMNENANEILIHSNEKELTLTCPELVKHLLEKEKEYLFTYEWKKSNTTKGNLYTAVPIN